MRLLSDALLLFGRFMKLAALALRQWGNLCVRSPILIWAWIWTRPWPLRARVGLVVGPWIFLLLFVFFPQILVNEYGAAPEGRSSARAIYAVAMPFVRARVSVAQVLSIPLDPRPSSGREHRQGDPPFDGPSVGRWLLANALLFGLYPFALSVLFGGPVWLPVLLVRGLRRGVPTVSGRELRPASVRSFGSWRQQADASGRWFVGGSLTGRGSTVIGEEARLMHTWVVGATGTGKTQSVLLPALRSDIRAGRAAIFIDGKGDRETFSAIHAMACESGREGDLRFFDLRRPEVSHSYSPLLVGTPNEQQDKIMAALRWENEYYRIQSKAVLLRVLRALESAGYPYSLDDLVVALSNPGALRILVDLVKDTERRSDLESVLVRFKEYHLETCGLRSQLESLLMTDFGELVKAAVPTLDLAEAYREGSIVYFALPVARFPETAPLLAKLVIADLNSVAGLVQEGTLKKSFASVVIDEFAAFAMPLFIDLLNKARSAGMAITVSHQSMRGDLVSAAKGFVEQVADNTNIKICLRQNADPEYVAGLSGTYRTTKRVEGTEETLFGHLRTGSGSEREADEYHVSPNLVREMPQGHAIVQLRYPQPLLDLVMLDRVDTSEISEYTPPPPVRAETAGLELRRRTRGAARPRRPLTPEDFS